MPRGGDYLTIKAKHSSMKLLVFSFSFLSELITQNLNTTHVVHVTNNNHDLISSVLGVHPPLKI